MNKTYPLMAVFIALTMTVGFAYADTVKFPTLTTDGMVDYKLDTFYPTNSTYIVQISILYEVPFVIEIPERITWYELNGKAHFIYLQDDFRLVHFPADEEKTPDFAGVLTEAQVQKVLADKRKELEAQDSSEFTKLRVCLEEFEEEQPVRYEAWKRIANLEEFGIPDQWINQDHYDRAQLEAQKKWVICEALKKYPHVGAWEANKGLDEDDKVLTADTSDSSTTIPVTEMAIDFEIMKAEQFQCSLQGKAQGLCANYMAGEKYVPPAPRLEDWYAEYRELKGLPLDYVTAIDEARATQCTDYFQLYNQTGAIEVPSWLLHCQGETLD